jgi:transposase-like protein
MSKTTYTDTGKATVYAHLAANGGNVKRTARETGVPISTVRDWKRTWEKEGVPENISEVLPSVVEDIVDDFTRVRNKLLIELEAQGERGELKGQALVSAIGMLTDKIRLFRGEATSRTESRQSLPDPAALRELVGQFLEDSVRAVEDRSEQIDEAEREPADRALSAAEEVHV